MVPRVLRRLPPYCSPILALRGLEFRSLLFGSRCENGKARPAAWGGGNGDAMTQNCEGLPHDEETDAETVTLCGIKPSERFEYPRNLLVGNSNARVVHVDTDFRTRASAAEKDATSRLSVLDRIAHQIAQGGAEKQAITEHDNVAGNRVDGYSLAQRGMFVIAAKDLLDPHRRQFEASRGLLNAHRGQELHQFAP